MDTNKPRTSDEEGAQPPPLPARSPYQPLSLRRRQAMPAAPRPAVERPKAATVFTVSPNTIGAALAKRSASNKTALVWGRSADGDAAEDPSGK